MHFNLTHDRDVVMRERHAPGFSTPDFGAGSFSSAASRVPSSVGFCPDGLTTRAAEKRFGESDSEFASDGGDRVLEVTLGPDRRRLWVVNDREGEVFRGVGCLRGSASNSVAALLEMGSKL
jgi:hypothetical protein